MTSCGARPSGEPGARMRRDHSEWMRIYCHGMQIILLDLEEKPKRGLRLERATTVKDYRRDAEGAENGGATCGDCVSGSAIKAVASDEWLVARKRRQLCGRDDWREFFSAKRLACCGE